MMIQYILTKAEWDDYHEANHILAKIKAILSTSGIYNHELSIPAMTMYLVAKNDELNAAHKTLKEVTEQRDGLRAGIDYASDQLTKVTEQRDEWKAKFIQQNKDLGCEMMDPNGTIWDYAKKLQSDLAAVTEQRDGLRAGIDCASDQLRRVTEQRDKALQKIKNQAERIAYLEGATNHATGTPLSKAIEQRDRLAEAIRKHKFDDVKLWQAIQSLNQPTEI